MNLHTSLRVISCLFFKQNTAYEMRISDWSSDVCSSDLVESAQARFFRTLAALAPGFGLLGTLAGMVAMLRELGTGDIARVGSGMAVAMLATLYGVVLSNLIFKPIAIKIEQRRSEEHTSELQSLMRISYAVFCLKKKKIQNINLESSVNKHRRENET